MDFDHPQGPGNIMSVNCSVVFMKIVPYDLVKTPYVLWISYGKHTHPPPRPTRVAHSVRNLLVDLISACSKEGLTFGKYVILN